MVEHLVSESDGKLPVRPAPRARDVAAPASGTILPAVQAQAPPRAEAPTEQGMASVAPAVAGSVASTATSTNAIAATGAGTPAVASPVRAQETEAPASTPPSSASTVTGAGTAEVTSPVPSTHMPASAPAGGP
jgi:hypothetical protein